MITDLRQSHVTSINRIDQQSFTMFVELLLSDAGIVVERQQAAEVMIALSVLHISQERLLLAAEFRADDGLDACCHGCLKERNGGMEVLVC